MKVQSLGYRTDLIFPKFEGQINDHGDYLVIKTDSNPHYHWGNFILFPNSPQKGDLVRWRDIFTSEIGGPPDYFHQAFGWDSTTADRGDLGAFIEAGFKVNQYTFLSATKDDIHRSPQHNPNVSIRPFEKESDWAAALEIQIACRGPNVSPKSFAEFIQRKMDRYRRMVASNLGFWFGAFVDDQLVSNLGIFFHEDLGRFQGIATHPHCKRKGFCGTLVYVAALHAFEERQTSRLVMGADENYSAAKIYESIGFRATERQIGINWWDYQL